MWEKDLAYFKTRMSDTSDKSATRAPQVWHEWHKNEKNATPVRHESDTNNKIE